MSGFDGVMERAMEEIGDEGCVLTKIWWVDEEGNTQQDVIDADIASLPQGVQDGLEKKAISTCIDETIIEMKEKIGDCAENFDDTEKETLGKIAEEIANFKCFLAQLDEAYVDTSRPLLEYLYIASRK